MDEHDLVSRQPASSGRVDYLQPVVIRGGKSTYLEVLPTFIRRTEGEDLNIKLRYWKTSAGAYRSGFPAEFTLDSDETAALGAVIERGFALVGKATGGRYLAVRLDDASQTSLEGQNLEDVGGALLRLLSDSHLAEAVGELPDASILLEGLQVRARSVALTTAVVELERALDDDIVDELWYQRWCEANAWAFGNAYAMRDDVRNIALGDSIDILLARTVDRFRDIYELKRPDDKVILLDSSHKSHYWSGNVSKTIGQCHRYLDALHEAAARGLRDHPELIAYHPEAIIVTGRSKTWNDEQLRGLHGLNSRLHGMRVMTYDHLLAQAKRSLEILNNDA